MEQVRCFDDVDCDVSSTSPLDRLTIQRYVGLETAIRGEVKLADDVRLTGSPSLEILLRFVYIAYLAPISKPLFRQFLRTSVVLATAMQCGGEPGT